MSVFPRYWRERWRDGTCIITMFIGFILLGGMVVSYVGFKELI